MAGPHETLVRFATRPIRFVDSARVERLIVDLRSNNGGSFLRLLIEGIAAS